MHNRTKSGQTRLYYKPDGTFVCVGNHMVTDDPNQAEFHRKQGLEVEMVIERGKRVWYIAT